MQCNAIQYNTKSYSSSFGISLYDDIDTYANVQCPFWKYSQNLKTKQWLLD